MGSNSKQNLKGMGAELSDRVRAIALAANLGVLTFAAVNVAISFI